MKKVLFWILGIFLIITFLVYFKVTMFPSILILMLGIILLPPIDEIIKKKIDDDQKIKKYKIIKGMVAIVIILIFLSNIPNEYKEKTQVNNQSDNEIETHTDGFIDVPNVDTSNIDKSEVDNSVALTVTETNGKYTGERIDGKKQGTGKYEWNDGMIYEGEFSNDQINGQGKLTYPQTGVYEGTFVDGKRNGEGKYIFTNGDVYQGNWKDDKMSGQGNYTFANGDSYVGEFSDNMFNGQGTYTKGDNKYTGTWSNNEYKK